jgi:hypothetical protein
MIDLDGRRYKWKAVVAAYREQAKRMAQPEQPALFAALRWNSHMACVPPPH